MNVVELCGGIGNQIFQYAFGQVQKYNGIDVRYSCRWYHKSQIPPRPFRLDKFQVNVKYGPFLRQPVINESDFKLADFNREDCNFHGYWQHLYYYKHILHMLRKELHVKEQYYTKEFLNLRDQIKDSSSISLHVRRGDYIGRKGFGVLPLRYYTDALALMGVGTVYVFSDDIEWCESVFKAEYFSRKFVFVHLEDYLDFELMRSCTHFILANSTFSYLPVILENTSDTKVVSPSGWLSSIDINDRIGNFPKHWIKLESYV